MRKYMFALAAAAAVGLSCPAFAAPAEPFSRPHRFSSEDMSAFVDARVAALEAGLQLTAEQKKNWPALETALREIGKAQIARMQEMRDGGMDKFVNDPLGALEMRAKTLAARATEFEKLSTVARPLYDSLDEAQKRRFGPLLRTAIHPRGGFGRGRHGRGRGMGGGGFGGPGME